ncbi:MAG: PIN domain-containing protein [Chloroflexi bacterium]|nr:PIN domain-containing protein [Chloroflexota bacterium]MCY3588724.1 PIN domain-containing protein [Chloroflexota bacterium]MCY3684765.1 PIN domain-containing protein [Chloroflexota bacterium]MDE2709798.1 PIN domain-containing protein [Chloroflexota bacterium]MYD53579.1 type II toxin-antitoxin system VapC family toxin [Chloroflexota bacterium]
MGSLTLPATGSVYLDTSAIIYSVERHEPYLTLLAPAWQGAAAGQFVIVCSELVLAEALVQPIRQENRYLEEMIRNVLAAPEVHLVPTTRQVWEETARLRAATGLKTPDALHAITARQVACASFITNDSDFRRVEDLPVVILDDLL